MRVAYGCEAARPVVVFSEVLRVLEVALYHIKYLFCSCLVVDRGVLGCLEGFGGYRAVLVEVFFAYRLHTLGGVCGFRSVVVAALFL